MTTLVGDSTRFLTLDELERRLDSLPPSPTDAGRVVLIVRRPREGLREVRFGADAVRFVSDPARAQRRLRGVYLRAVEAGEIRTGDAVEVMSRVRRGT